MEKYRPKTLDDVAAHKEIIDTSALGPSRPLYPSMHPAFTALSDIPGACMRSQAARERRQVPPRAVLWPAWHGEDVHYFSSGTPDVRRLPQVGAVHYTSWIILICAWGS